MGYHGDPFTGERTSIPLPYMGAANGGGPGFCPGFGFALSIDISAARACLVYFSSHAIFLFLHEEQVYM